MIEKPVVEGLGSGYGSKQYVQSLLAGAPVRLPNCDGWFIEKVIDTAASPGLPVETDLMGPYPLFQCGRWDALEDDIKALGDRHVSVSMVVDPFADVSEEQLRSCFPDVLFRYKEHFVTDLEMDPAQFIHSTHRRKMRRALRELSVDVVADSPEFEGVWTDLYSQLVRRHAITGMANFSRESLALQLAAPGMLAIVAKKDSALVGAALWLIRGDVAYYHLAAYSDLGYEFEASFAIFGMAVDYFRTRVRYLALGGGPGVKADPTDGLVRFKKGWSTGIKPAYFGGRILNPKAYERLCAAKGKSGSDFFPAYRAK